MSLSLRLAGDESWQPARLFSISGVGNSEEQEKRATSALLATMMGVRAFGRGICARLGAPAGVIETIWRSRSSAVRERSSPMA